MRKRYKYVDPDADLIKLAKPINRMLLWNQIIFMIRDCKLPFARKLRRYLDDENGKVNTISWEKFSPILESIPDERSRDFVGYLSGGVERYFILEYFKNRKKTNE